MTPRAASAAVVLLVAAAGLAGPHQASALPEGGARSAASSAAAEGPALSVDTTTGRKAIDPHIYGINFADEALAEELRLPVRRWGGNATSRYNYPLDAYNAGHDWYFENLYYENGTAQLPDGSQADMFVEQDRRTGTDTVMTVPHDRLDARGAQRRLRLQHRQVRAAAAERRPVAAGLRQRCEARRHERHRQRPDATPASPAGPEFTKGWVEYLKRHLRHRGRRRRPLLQPRQRARPVAEHPPRRPPARAPATTRCATARTPPPPPSRTPTRAAQTLGPVGWGFNSLIYSGLDQKTCGERPAGPSACSRSCWPPCTCSPRSGRSRSTRRSSRGSR